MRNEMKISRYTYIYISSLIALNLKIEIFLHRTCRTFYKILPFLGLTLCFQLNKEEEWREECKKNKKKQKKRDERENT